MNLALNPFDKGKKPEEVDEVKGDTSSIEDAIERFYKLSEDQVTDGDFDKAILNPNEIVIVYKRLYEIGKREDDITHYIGNLIQASFDDGYNDFHLDLIGSFFFDSFIGKKDKHLNLTLNGVLDETCFRESEYMDAVIEGDLNRDLFSIAVGMQPRPSDSFCGNVKSCNVTVRGDVNLYCGSRAYLSSFRVYGDVTGSLGYAAQHSTFYVKGRVSEFVGNKSKNCVFFTDNKKTFHDLNNLVSDQSRVILL